MRKLFGTAALLVCVLPTSGQAQTYQQTKIVSPVIGNWLASGNALRDAVASITDAQWGKRYLIKVEPGVYDLEQDPLLMKPFVDIEGSGRRGTLLRGKGRASGGPYHFGVIHGASNAELRSLTVQALGDRTAGKPNVVALFNEEATSFRDLDIRVSGGWSCWGVRTVASTPWLKDLNIWVNCGSYSAGIASRDRSRPIIEDTEIRAFGAGYETGNVGIFVDAGAVPTRFRGVNIVAGQSSDPGTGIYFGNYGSGGWFEIVDTSIHTNGGVGLFSTVTLSLKVRHSNFVANRIGIRVPGQWMFVHSSLVAGSEYTLWGSSVNVGASHLEGGPILASSAVCAGVYDENFTFFADQCP